MTVIYAYIHTCLEPDEPCSTKHQQFWRQCLLQIGRLGRDTSIPQSLILACPRQTSIHAHSTKWCRNSIVIRGFKEQWYPIKSICKVRDNDVLPFSNVAKSRINVGDKGGLWLYLPTSANAVTNLKPPVLVFTKTDGLIYPTVMPTSYGLVMCILCFVCNIILFYLRCYLSIIFIRSFN